MRSRVKTTCSHSNRRTKAIVRNFESSRAVVESELELDGAVASADVNVQAFGEV